jgi:hypothetical protein
MPQVKRLLDWNRGGRRLFFRDRRRERTAAQLLASYILARSSTDRKRNANVLFHFLREIPNVLVAKDGSRKRKRGD